jgi:hypothetical protein
MQDEDDERRLQEIWQKVADLEERCKDAEARLKLANERLAEAGLEQV